MSNAMVSVIDPLAAGEHEIWPHSVPESVRGMLAIYVAGPFRASNVLQMELNIRRAEMVSHSVLAAGHAPICPHTMTRFFQDSLPDQTFIDATLAMMLRCDGVVVLPEWHASEGTRGEIQLAERLGMPLRFLAAGAVSVNEMDRYAAVAEAVSSLVAHFAGREGEGS